MLQGRQGEGQVRLLQLLARSAPPPSPCSGCAGSLVPPPAQPVMLAPPVSLALQESASSSGGWGIAADVFHQRYQAGVSHTAGAWQPLPHVSLALDPAAAAAAGSGSGTFPRSHPATLARPAGSAAPPRPPITAAPPQLEPWLLAAGAYGEAASWQQPTARSTRARMLFQYKPYSQQEPLGLEEGEVAAVVEAVFGKMGGGPAAFQVGTQTPRGGGAEHCVAAAAPDAVTACPTA